jgi:hypothetical protein
METMDDDDSSIEHINTSYPEELFYRCPVCGEPVQHCFPSSKHDYLDFVGMVREIRYQYRCMNPSCRMAGIYFNPAPARVLPYKQFSLDVWKWIAREAKIFKQKPSEIVFRAKVEHGIPISEGTVRNIIDEVDVFISGRIDRKTIDIIKKQKCMLLALDGQDPEKGGPALWMFTDVLSNRVLAIDILDCASKEVLHGIIMNIEQRFGVPIIGFISDKERSIVNMHDDYYPNIPHQYCQFHFMGNMWNHLEVRDDNVNKELKKVVNNLYISTIDKKQAVNIKGAGNVSVYEHFKDVASDLKKIVGRRTKKFEKLRGIDSYKNLSAYAETIELTCSREDPGRRDVKILRGIASKLYEGLKTVQQAHVENTSLFKIFQSIRIIFNQPGLSKEMRVRMADACFDSLWDRARGECRMADPSRLRSIQLSYQHSKAKVLLEWYRLYQSYKRGLFAYYDFPVPERTNVKMEASFSKEKQRLFSQCGKRNVGAQVRKRGEYILKQIHTQDGEIESIVDDIPGKLDPKSIREGLQELTARIKKETESWRFDVDAKETIKQLFDKRKKDEN